MGWMRMRIGQENAGAGAGRGGCREFLGVGRRGNTKRRMYNRLPAPAVESLPAKVYSARNIKEEMDTHYIPLDMCPR